LPEFFFHLAPGVFPLSIVPGLPRFEGGGGGHGGHGLSPFSGEGPEVVQGEIHGAARAAVPGHHAVEKELVPVEGVGDALRRGGFVIPDVEPLVVFPKEVQSPHEIHRRSSSPRAQGKAKDHFFPEGAISEPGSLFAPAKLPEPGGQGAPVFGPAQGEAEVGGEAPGHLLPRSVVFGEPALQIFLGEVPPPEDLVGQGAEEASPGAIVFFVPDQGDSLAVRPAIGPGAVAQEGVGRGAETPQKGVGRGQGQGLRWHR